MLTRLKRLCLKYLDCLKPSTPPPWNPPPPPSCKFDSVSYMYNINIFSCSHDYDFRFGLRTGELNSGRSREPWKWKTERKIKPRVLLRVRVLHPRLERDMSRKMQVHLFSVISCLKPPCVSARQDVISGNYSADSELSNDSFGLKIGQLLVQLN